MRIALILLVCLASCSELPPAENLPGDPPKKTEALLSTSTSPYLTFDSVSSSGNTVTINFSFNDHYTWPTSGLSRYLEFRVVTDEAGNPPKFNAIGSMSLNIPFSYVTKFEQSNYLRRFEFSGGDEFGESGTGSVTITLSGWSQPNVVIAGAFASPLGGGETAFVNHTL